MVILSCSMMLFWTDPIVQNERLENFNDLAYIDSKIRKLKSKLITQFEILCMLKQVMTLIDLAEL